MIHLNFNKIFKKKKVQFSFICVKLKANRIWFPSQLNAIAITQMDAKVFIVFWILFKDTLSERIDKRYKSIRHTIGFNSVSSRLKNVAVSLCWVHFEWFQIRSNDTEEQTQIMWRIWVISSTVSNAHSMQWDANACGPGAFSIVPFVRVAISWFYSLHKLMSIRWNVNQWNIIYYILKCSMHFPSQPWV